MSIPQQLKDRDDKWMMQHPDWWSQWPKLPVKRRQNDRELQMGVMFAEDKPIVYLVNMFEKIKDIAEIQRMEYASFDALIEDGWIVD